jgi:hypothetical protein
MSTRTLEASEPRCDIYTVKRRFIIFIRGVLKLMDAGKRYMQGLIYYLFRDHRIERLIRETDTSGNDRWRFGCIGLAHDRLITWLGRGYVIVRILWARKVPVGHHERGCWECRPEDRSRIHVPQCGERIQNFPLESLHPSVLK